MGEMNDTTRGKSTTTDELMDMMDSAHVTRRPRHTVFQLVNKEQLTKIIYAFHGIVPTICQALEVSEHGFWVAVGKWDLKEVVEDAKRGLVEQALKVLSDSLESKSESTRLRAAELVLRQNQPKTQTVQTTVKVGDVETQIQSIFGIREDGK